MTDYSRVGRSDLIALLQRREYSFAAYQVAAARTVNVELTESERLLQALLGLAGETGEVVDYMKKVLYHGHALDKEKLSDELGDVLWYIAELASAMGLDLDRVARQNVEKLKARYPEGFNTERSVERA